MSAQEFLQAELRLLYQYDESTTYQKDAQRILAGLMAFADLRPTSSLVAAIEKAGAEITYVNMDQDDPELCGHVMVDGAECGYPISPQGPVCEYGHRQ